MSGETNAERMARRIRDMPAEDLAVILHRLRTGEGQCKAEKWTRSTFDADLTVLDRCLGATDHEDDHEGMYGKWAK